MDDVPANLSGLQTIKFVDDTTGYEYGSLTGDRARAFAANAVLIKLLAGPGAPTTITVPIPFRPDQLRLFLYFLENIPLGNLHPGERSYIDYIKPFDEYLKRQVFGFFGIDLPNQMALFRLTRIHPIVERVQQRILEQPSIENNINQYVRTVKENIRRNESALWSNTEGATRHLLQKEEEKLARARAQETQYEQNLLTQPHHKKPTRQQEENLQAHIRRIQDRIGTFTRKVQRLERLRSEKARRQAARWERYDRYWNSSSEGTNNRYDYDNWNGPDPLIEELRARFLDARMKKIGKTTPAWSLNWEWENDPLLEKTVRNYFREIENTPKQPLRAYQGPNTQATPAQKAAIEKKVKYRASVEAYWHAKFQRNANNNLKRKGRSPMTAKNRSALNTKLRLMESTLNMNRPNAQWGNLA